MIALRLVLDTNVLVSAALKPNGLERTALTLALTKPARLYVSQPILQEYRLVLARTELRIRKGLRRQVLQLTRNRSHIVRPKQRLDVAPDPEDNKFLECADAARADYIITGNRRHFPRFWKPTKVVSAREFVELAAPPLI